MELGTQFEFKSELLGYWGQYGGREASRGVGLGTRVYMEEAIRYDTVQLKGYVGYILNIILI
jgi:hypothetical protein